MGDGTALPYGEGMLIVSCEGTARKIGVDAGRLSVPGDTARAGIRVRAFLREAARAALVPASRNYADLLGREIGRITLRDTRSRWGSCSSTGDLMYSWRLIMAPAGVLDYVAAHEVAHLAEMNHSARFWSVVERLRPDYQSARDWLKRHGAGLHRYDFG